MDNKSTSYFNIGSLILFGVIVIGDLGLFKLVFIPTTASKLLPLVGIIVIIIFLVLGWVYGSNVKVHKNFALPIFLFLLSAFISPFVALNYYNQPYYLSIWISISLLFYLFYFLLHSIDIETRVLERMIISIGIFVIILFYIQYVLYPIRIFNEGVLIRLDRGTLRFWVPGMGFAVVTYYYCLNRFFQKNKLKYLIVVLLIFIMYVIQGTRQSIASLLLLSIIFFFRSKEVKSRMLIIVLALGGAITVFFTFYDLLFEMYRVSQLQFSSTEENVRVRAAIYFLTDFMPSNWAYIFGNAGGHQRSLYGQYTLRLSTVYGFWLSDIGLIGDYVKYGLLFLIGAIIMLFKLVTMKVKPEYEYLRYYIYGIILTLFTGRGNFGTADMMIIIIAYLFDRGSLNMKNNRQNHNNTDPPAVEV
jgi:hypothetical protein